MPSSVWRYIQDGGHNKLSGVLPTGLSAVQTSEPMGTEPMSKTRGDEHFVYNERDFIT